MRGHVGFHMCSHLQHQTFVAETKKIQTDLIFFFVVSATKNFRKKVAKKEI